MSSTNPGDPPDRPSLQTGSLRSGLNPAGMGDSRRDEAPTQRPIGVFPALGVLVLLLVAIVLLRGLLG